VRAPCRALRWCGRGCPGVQPAPDVSRSGAGGGGQAAAQPVAQGLKGAGERPWRGGLALLQQVARREHGDEFADLAATQATAQGQLLCRHVAVRHVTEHAPMRRLVVGGRQLRPTQQPVLFHSPTSFSVMPPHRWAGVGRFPDDRVVASGRPVMKVTAKIDKNAGLRVRVGDAGRARCVGGPRGGVRPAL
jgi:hypothetical protein